MPVRWLDGMPREEGVRDLVIAWTLGLFSFERAMDWQYGLGMDQPVKGAC